MADCRGGEKGGVQTTKERGCLEKKEKGYIGEVLTANRGRENEKQNGSFGSHTSLKKRIEICRVKGFWEVMSVLHLGRRKA